MRRPVLAATALLGFGGLTPARAQFPGPVCGPGLAVRGGFAAGGPGFRVTGFAGGYYARPLVVTPVAPFFGGWPGYGPGYGNPYFLPPSAGLMPPIVVVAGAGNGYANRAGGFFPDDPFAANPGKPDPARPDGDANPLPPGARRDQFLVISPQKNAAPSGPAAVAPGMITPEIDRVTRPAAPPAVAPVDPFAVRPDTVNVERAEANPAAESARLVRLAREAFAAEQYGRAADHLDRAAKANPDDPLPHFLKAQVRLASGQYPAAVVDIREGLRRAPDWPAGGFRPRELYGGRPERFDAHLVELRKALAENPGNPALEFLLGYQLWFRGEKPEAVALFRAAAGRVKDRGVIERFLREADRW